jgi:hypothetical protein
MPAARIALLVAALGATACTPLVIHPVPEPAVVEDETPRYEKRGKLGIPRGHLPPPGRCRIWVPGRPPGHQPPAGGCASLADQVPPGAWLVRSTAKHQARIEVSVYHESRPHTIVAVRHYDAKTRRFLAEEYRR